MKNNKYKKIVVFPLVFFFNFDTLYPGLFRSCGSQASPPLAMLLECVKFYDLFSK